MSDISREELTRRLRSRSLTVVNVLPRDSWERHHVPGSVNLPLEEIRDLAGVVLPDRDREIVLYCGGPT